MRTQSKTDWERVKREAEQDAPIAFDLASDLYNPNDEKSVAAHWDGALLKQGGVVIGQVKTRGKGKRPTKEQVAVRYDADVLEAFRATGTGWQTRMNDALKEWLKEHAPG
jgi:uncharacterized protein (DUF4415 family)